MPVQRNVMRPPTDNIFIGNQMPQQQQQAPQPSLFGYNHQLNNAWSAPPQTNNSNVGSSLFGNVPQQQSRGGIFGSAPPPSNSLFGNVQPRQQSNNSLFGNVQPQQQSNNLFGNVQPQQ